MKFGIEISLKLWILYWPSSGIFFTKYYFHTLQIKGLGGKYFPSWLKVNATFSWNLPDFFGLLLALSCQHFKHILFLFKHIFDTYPNFETTFYFFLPEETTIFCRWEQEIFIFVVYASTLHITLSDISESCYPVEHLCKLTEERSDKS